MKGEKLTHIFIVYSRKDIKILNEFRAHLKVLERTLKVKVWYDELIEPGENWKQSITDNLNKANIILLIISHNFIASDYCYEKEMTQALTLHDKGKVKVIPIIARSCLWQDTPIARLQALPKDGQPIAADWKVNRNRPFLQIVKELKSIITDMHLPKQQEEQPQNLVEQQTGFEILVAKEGVQFQAEKIKDKVSHRISNENNSDKIKIVLLVGFGVAIIGITALWIMTIDPILILLIEWVIGGFVIGGVMKWVLKESKWSLILLVGVVWIVSLIIGLIISSEIHDAIFKDNYGLFSFLIGWIIQWTIIGLAIGVVTKLKYIKLNWMQVFLITFGWVIAGVIGGLISYAIGIANSAPTDWYGGISKVIISNVIGFPLSIVIGGGVMFLLVQRLKDIR